MRMVWLQEVRKMTSTLVDTAAFSLVLGHSVEMFLIVNIHVPKYDFFVEL